MKQIYRNTVYAVWEMAVIIWDTANGDENHKYYFNKSIKQPDYTKLNDSVHN